MLVPWYITGLYLYASALVHNDTLYALPALVCIGLYLTVSICIHNYLLVLICIGLLIHITVLSHVL